MKRPGAFILVAALMLSLASCGGGKDIPDGSSGGSSGASSSIPEESSSLSTGSGSSPISATPIRCGESIDNENFCMTFDSVELHPEYSYQTSEYSTTSLYVEEGYKLVIVKGHFENKAASAISDSSFVFSAVVNDSYVVDGYDVRLCFIRDKYFEIDPYTDLDYVLYINIPEKLADMFDTVTFTIGFNGDMSAPAVIWNSDGTKTTETDHLYALTSGISSNQETVSIGAGSTASGAETISIGDTITTNDYEFTLTNVELTYEVLPPNTSSVYASYAAESGKVYVHVAADIKNTMQRDIRINELFTSSALYDGKYTYDGFTVVNDGDNRFDWVGSYIAATPLETCKAHSIIECPVEVDTSGKSVVVSLDLGGTIYEYTVR